MKINLETYELYVIDYLEGNLSGDLQAEFDVFLLMNPEIKDELFELDSFTVQAIENINFDKSKLQKDLFSSENIEDNFEDLCIDYIENQLNDEEKSQFENYLSFNIEKEKVFKKFQKTVLDKKFITKKENFKSLLRQLILEESYFNDEISIAYVEGDLSKNERVYFEELILLNSDLGKNVKLYNKLNIKSNINITFSNKLSLRKKERKPVLLWTSIALAASIFLFGFFLLQRMTTDTNSLISENENNTNELFVEKEIPKLERITTDSTKKNAVIENTNLIFSKNERKEITINKEEETVVEIRQTNYPLAYLSREFEIQEVKVPVSPFDEKIEFKANTIILNSVEAPVYAAEETFKIPKVKFWKVASVAVKLFTKATNSGLVLSSEYDEEGNLLALDIVSDRFNYTKEYSKPK